MRSKGVGSVKILAAAVILGVAGGVGVALHFRSRRPEPPPSPSYYLSNFRPGGLEVSETASILLSPRSVENIPAACPPGLTVLYGKDSYATHIAPWLRAMSLDFPREEAEPLAADAAEALTRAAGEMAAIAGGPVGTPPLRILVRHYPRPGLRGRCFTVAITMANVVDPWFDQDIFARQTARAEERPPVRGTLIEIRKTYQDGGGEVRLIEARVQVQQRLRLMPLPLDLPELIGDERVHAVATDSQSSAHYTVMGGGERLGLVWYDLSAGMGPPDPWSAAYSLAYADPARPPELKLGRLTPGLLDALLRVARES